MRLQHTALASLWLLFSPWLQAIEVVDDRGYHVVLDTPAKRVIALAPHIVEIVYAVGGADAIVGAVNYSDYPEAAKHLPQVGSYKSFSVEAVLRLQPDLILAWHTGNGEARVQKLQDLGFKVYWTEPKTLGGVSRSMRNIGLLLGKVEAEQAADTFDQTLASLKTTYSHKTPVSVFYQVWNEPLQTLNGEHLISDVMSLCGGVNVFGDAPSLAPKISVESVLRANPQVIIASGMAKARPEWLDEWRNWPQLQAMQHQQLYHIPPDIIQRHTPRVLQGATIMCQQIDQARRVYQQPEGGQ